MKLIEYLKTNCIGDEVFASMLGNGVTGRAVRKWRYGETNPRIPELVRIQEITNGAVTPNDFLPDAPGSRTPALEQRDAAE